MIAVVRVGGQRRWSVCQYGEWLVYTLPARVGEKTRRRIVTDALLAGCRYYLPDGNSRFFADSPLAVPDVEEYRLLRLPDAAVMAARSLGLPPAQCPAQVLADTVNFCCEKTVVALAGCCRDVTLVTRDEGRAVRLSSRLLSQHGLPLRLTARPDWAARGVICSLGGRDTLAASADDGRVLVAQDLYEVDYTAPFACDRPPTELAGALYAATRADWLRRLAVTRILPLDK